MKKLRLVSGPSKAPTPARFKIQWGTGLVSVGEGAAQDPHFYPTGGPGARGSETSQGEAERSAAGRRGKWSLASIPSACPGGTEDTGIPKTCP